MTVEALAAVELAKPDVKKSAHKSRKRGGQKQKTQARTKIVVRRLPPNLPEDIFKGSIAKWIEDTDWLNFVAGKVAKSQAKINVFSTAYLNFKTVEVMLDFCNSYNGHVFVDSRGTESRALVEFAPFQRIPKKKKKTDSRANTIEEDADYLKFLKSLEEPTSPKAGEGAITNTDVQLEKREKKLTADQTNGKGTVVSATSYAAAATVSPPVNPKSTPLLDALRAKKASMRAAIELNKQANIAKKAEKRAEEAKVIEIAKKNAKPTATVRLAKKGDKQESQPAVAPKRQEPAPPAPAANKSPEKKKRDGAKREKIAPSGSLFNKTLGAVLGKQEVKKPRASEGKKVEQAVMEEPVAATTQPAPAKAPQGRGYKSKRQAFANAAAETTEGDETPPTNAVAEKASPSTSARSSPKVPRAAKNRDAAETAASGNAPAKASGKTNRGSKARDADASGTKEVGKTKQKKGNTTPAEGTAAKRAPSGVSIAKRDGNTINANTRGEGS